MFTEYEGNVKWARSMWLRLSCHRREELNSQHNLSNQSRIFCSSKKIFDRRRSVWLGNIIYGLEWGAEGACKLTSPAVFGSSNSHTHDTAAAALKPTAILSLQSNRANKLADERWGARRWNSPRGMNLNWKLVLVGRKSKLLLLFLIFTIYGSDPSNLARDADHLLLKYTSDLRNTHIIIHNRRGEQREKTC